VTSSAVERTWTVRDVMSEDVLTATVDTPFKVLVEQLLLGGVSGLPAVGRTAGDLMTSPAITIGPDASLAAAAGQMRRYDLRRLPVVDAAGRLVGIVSRADLLKVFMRTDGAIRQAARDVLDVVLSEPEAVTVSVSEGIVTLAGEVEAQPEAEAAIVRIEALPGVVGVEDHLHAAV
jgi:CBS domain-containing protein